MFEMQGGYNAVTTLEKQGTPEAVFANGKVGFLYATVATRESSFMRQWPDLQYTYMDYPLPKGGKPANYSGTWAICMPQGARNPDAATALLEHLYSPDVDLQWAAAFLRIPARMSVARSDEYIKRDPALRIAVDGMRYARFVPSMPGAEACLPLYSQMATDVMSGKLPVREALRQTQDKLQVELDKLRGQG